MRMDPINIRRMIAEKMERLIEVRIDTDPSRLGRRYTMRFGDSRRFKEATVFLTEYNERSIAPGMVSPEAMAISNMMDELVASVLDDMELVLEAKKFRE